MTLRGVTGRPLRAGFTVPGVAMAVPLMVVSQFWNDALHDMIDIQTPLADRAQVSVTFATPVSTRAARARAALGDGYAVNVAIMVASLPGVVTRPTSALFRESAGWRVFRVLDGVACMRTVERGLTTPTETAITAGLQPGDHVVPFPGDSLRDGMRVTGRLP